MFLLYFILKLLSYNDLGNYNAESLGGKTIYVYYYVYCEVYMRTNIVLNDALVAEAFKYSANIHTKKELVETALQEYIQNRKVKDIRDLKGKIDFYENYDYKEMRIGK